MKRIREDELQEELIDQIVEKAKCGISDFEDIERLQFLEDFSNATPWEQYNRYMEFSGHDIESERGKEDNFIARSILIPKQELLDFIQKNNFAQCIDVWDDVDVVLSVSEHFEVPPAIARYRMLEVAQSLQEEKSL